MARVLLIDGSNFYRSSRELGFNVDYKKLLDFFNEDRDVFKAFYFTALPPKNVVSPIRRLTDWLSYNGYSVVSKQTQEWTDPVTGTVKVKGNMDLEIATAAIELSDHVSEVVLFTGDGDFRCLVELLQRKYGKKVVAVSSAKIVSDDLRRQVDVYIDLKNIMDYIKLAPRQS